ncbi:MAG: hypothetical protein ACOC1G_03320 [Phycisphaeraceae bacterium]
MIITAIIFLLLAIAAAIFGIADVTENMAIFSWIAFLIFFLTGLALLVRGLTRKKGV